MAEAAVSIPEMVFGWKRVSQVSAGYGLDLMLSIRSCGQALLWSCYVVLAYGIVWANVSIC
jgi:hypothetical protein